MCSTNIYIILYQRFFQGQAMDTKVVIGWERCMTSLVSWHLWGPGLPKVGTTLLKGWLYSLHPVNNEDNIKCVLLDVVRSWGQTYGFVTVCCQNVKSRVSEPLKSEDCEEGRQGMPIPWHAILKELFYFKCVQKCQNKAKSNYIVISQII